MSESKRTRNTLRYQKQFLLVAIHQVVINFKP